MMLEIVGGVLCGLLGLLAGRWLFVRPPCAWRHALSVPGPLLVRTQVLTREQNTIEGRSGEAKRHQVYARLIKDFPETSHRVLARAIEDALAD